MELTVVPDLLRLIKPMAASAVYASRSALRPMPSCRHMSFSFGKVYPGFSVSSMIMSISLSSSALVMLFFVTSPRLLYSAEVI